MTHIAHIQFFLRRKLCLKDIRTDYMILGANENIIKSIRVIIND